MIELKTLLFYYFSSLPAFVTLGILWYSGRRALGENITMREGIVVWVVIQLALFVPFGVGLNIVNCIFKLLGI